jgi:hypothetical protein
MTNIVDEMYKNYEELLDHIKQDEVSLQNWAQDNVRRVLVFVMANYFENEIEALIVEFAKQKSKNELVSSFIQKSMERRYDTYFDWKSHNASKFFAFFGDEFQKKANDEVRSEPKLAEAIGYFIEIGNARNILAHERFEVADIGSKTAKEFYEAFNKALYFLEYLREKLK